MKIKKDIYMVGSGQIRLSNRMDCHVYLIDGGERLALIDAGVGQESELIFGNMRKHGYEPRDLDYILLTHCHADHAGGCSWIKEQTSCQVLVPKHEDDLLERGSERDLGLDIAKKSNIYPEDYKFSHCEVDHVLEDGEKIHVGKYELTVIQVPGHSRGSSCFLLEQKDSRVLFSSDIIFFGGNIGVLNCPGSSLKDYRKYIGRLAGLSVDALLPGHFLWTLRDGQEHIDRAVENLRSLWVPPAWRHSHPLS